MAVITRASDREVEQMRRSALGSTQGPTDEQQANTLNASLSRVGFKAQDPTSVSFPFLNRMRRDHMVAMGLHFIAMDVISAPWWYDGDDARVQAYADKLIRPIYVDLVLAALRMLSYGYSDGARNFDTARPNWTYFEGGQAKKVWDNGTIDAIVYREIVPLEPESSAISWDAQGRFNGIMYDNRYGTAGAFIIDGKHQPNIDKLHSWWITHDRMAEHGNPYGFPRIAYCAPIFYMYRWIWDLIARGFENSFDPGPVVRYPREDAVAINADGEREDPVKGALRVGSRRRTGSTVALPSDVYRDLQDRATNIYKWAIEYPKADTNFDAVMEFIGYLEAAKLNSLFLPEQSLTEGKGGSSSRNVAENFSDQRSTSQNMLIKQIQEFITGTFVTPVIQMVFPLYQGELTMKSIGAGGAATDMMRQVFQLVGQQDFRRFGIDMRRLAEANDFPMLDPVEQQKELEEQQRAAASITNQSPPRVEPTQGRRALVTQTGFGEMEYHRIEQRRTPVEFSSRDGDFVAALPRNEAFADATVVSHARALRRAYEHLAEWAGQELAGHVARSRDLSEPDRLVRDWVPDFERLDEYVENASKPLADVCRRSGSIALADQQINVDHWVERRVVGSTQEIITGLRRETADRVLTALSTDATNREVSLEVKAAVQPMARALADRAAAVDSQLAYNRGALAAGSAGAVKFAQVLDPKDVERHGMIVPVEQMLLMADDPIGVTPIRLLPSAPDELTIRHESLEVDRAAYDQETATVLIDPTLAKEEKDVEAQFLIALGDKFS